MHSAACVAAQYEGPELVPLSHVTAIARAHLLQPRRLMEIPHHAACCRAAKHPAGGGVAGKQTPAEASSGLPEGPGPPEGAPAAPEANQKEPFKWPMGDHLTDAQKFQLTELLDEFRDIFAFDMREMGHIEGESFKIPVTDETPIFRRQYRLAETEKQILREQVEERLDAGFIRRSMSQWASPITMPPKKDEFGNWTAKRPCGDYRPLNKVSVTDHYQLPTPEEIFDAIEGSTWFTTLDLRWGYHQVKIAEEDCCKTAFWGPDGLYEWVVMPFGLKNAPAFFQRIMDSTLRTCRNFARCYIDDIIVHSKSFEDHLVHLRTTFTRVREKGVRLHPKKMKIAMPSVAYLGHEIVPNGTATQKAKIDAIVRMPAPKDVTELRAFIGSVDYYRKFIRDCSKIAAPLNNLKRDEVAWDWDEACQKAFETLKQKLTEAPILRRPDYTRPFELHTDWSHVGLGAVLAQRDDQGREYVVAYASRSNNRAEANYSSYQGECLAAVWAVQHFRVHLYGRRFTLVTDHEPLKWLMTNERLRGMHARWANLLQEYDFEIVHRQGVKNLNADGLSRNPLPSDADETDARMDHCVLPMDRHPVAASLAMLATSTPVPDTEPAEDESDAPGESHPVDSQDNDIWQDSPVLEYLQASRRHSPGITAKERDRIWHRSKGYRFDNGVLYKRMAAGTEKVVPRPEQRANLIRRVHQDVGHYGVKKTYSLLEPTYWWVGMFNQVQYEVAACTACDRAKASFEVRDPVLKPLPIMGMFYRWGVDLCKMPVISTDGNRYVVVMIEHFSKWVELVPIPEKTAANTAEALKRVLTMFGAPAEVLTDQGDEFRGEFDELLQRMMIDHRRTSRNHPQADGLAERTVQTIKTALRKYCLVFNKHHWDKFLPWIAMGYRMSRQTSLAGYSPYFLLFGRHPLVGTKVRDVVQKVVDLDDPDVWARVVNDRAKLFEKDIPAAFDNLLIAQHRDTLRYAHTRSGNFQPKLHRFEVGDLVYLRRQKADSLDSNVGRLILRVKQVLGSGRIVLEGRDKKTVKEHVENCAPCHNPNIDLWQNPRLAQGDVDQACQVCHKVTRGAHMLLCDKCNEGWHMKCLDPPLHRRPTGDWFCPRCEVREFYGATVYPS